MNAAVHELQQRRTPDPRGVPPKSNIDAELDLLAACLWKPGTFDIVADLLKPEHFYVDSHRVLWAALEAVGADGCDVSTVTVRNYLADRQQLEAAGGVKAIHALELSRPAVAFPERVAAVIKNCWRQRELGSRCQRIAAECYFDVGDLQAYIEKSEAEIGALGHSDRADTSASMLTCITETMGQLSAGVPTGIKTGLAAHDDLTHGLHRGGVTILGGRPGMGKSAMAMQLAQYVALSSGESGRLGVAVFSLEMKRGELATRTLCSAARVDSNVIKTGKASQLDWRYLTDAAPQVAKAAMMIDDRAAITPAQLRSRCRQVRAKFKRDGIDLALVVVDYLQLMDGRFGTKGKSDKEAEVSYCSSALKTLAKEMNVAVLACAQLNRDKTITATCPPQLHHLRGSGSIEQDADAVVFLHRPEYYLLAKTPGEERGIAWVVVAKQRSGRTGIRRCKWFEKFTLFEDLDANDSRFDSEND